MKYQEIPTNLSGIYKINFPNGKIYIGRAKDIKTRIREHYQKKDNTPCQYALYKYFNSYEDIDIDILETIQEYNHELICSLEVKWIAKFEATNKEKGYNVTPGGDGAAIGVYNSASKITEEELDNIILLLKEQKTNVYIGNLYGLHPDTIGKINNGKHYRKEGIEYPIRKNRGITEYNEKYNSFSKEQLDTVLYLLKTTKLTSGQISKQTGISVKVITSLNNGKHPYCKLVDLTFPIRKTRKNIRLTSDEIIKIKEELLNSNYSIQDIANHFKCDRSTISDINQGKRHSKENEKYPIRDSFSKLKS